MTHDGRIVAVPLHGVQTKDIYGAQAVISVYHTMVGKGIIMHFHRISVCIHHYCSLF